MKHKWSVPLMLVISTSVYAQSTVQVRRGTPMFFDHDEQSILVTEKYALCQDTLDNCQDLTNVVRLQGSLTFQFPLPTWVTNGAHIYVLRAFGEGEWSDPSASLTLQVTGKPLPPVNFRKDPPPSTGTTAPTTTTTTPVPAGMSFTGPKTTTTKPKP